MASRCQRAYILPLWFFSFFLLSFIRLFRRIISEVTKQISTKLGHIFTYDCYLKNLVRTPRAFTLSGWGKTRFLGPTLNFDCNGTRYQQSERKTCQSTQTPLYAPNLVNFGPETAENGCRVFAHPINFRIWRHCRPYRMDVI